MKIEVRPFSSGLADLVVSAESRDEEEQLEELSGSKFAREGLSPKMFRFRVIALEQEMQLRNSTEEIVKNADAIRETLLSMLSRIKDH